MYLCKNYFKQTEKMDTIVKKRIKRAVAMPTEKVKRARKIKKMHRLDELFGCLKGKIFYDDDIFGFAK